MMSMNSLFELTSLEGFDVPAVSWVTPGNTPTAGLAPLFGPPCPMLGVGLYPMPDVFILLAALPYPGLLCAPVSIVLYFFCLSLPPTIF